MKKTDKIFVAGHNGLVGSAIVRQLENQGYINIITKSRKELDLRNQYAVDRFFDIFRPDYVFLAAAKAGGIFYNKIYPADFITENLQIQTNVITSAYQYKVKKLLFLGSACFIKGQMVFTSSGYKNIEDVNIGDRVLTHNNNFKEVYNTNKKTVFEIIEVCSVGNEKIVCTLDHKFLTKTNGWVEAKDLTVNDYLCISKKYNFNNNKNIEIFNEDIKNLFKDCSEFQLNSYIPKTQREHRWTKNSFPRIMKFKNYKFDSEKEYSISYLIGSFLAKGWIDEYNPINKQGSKHVFLLSPGFDNVYISNIEKSLSNLTDNYNVRTYKTSTKISISNKEFCEFFNQFYLKDVKDKRAHTKTIPEFVFNLSDKSIIQIIKGYWDGDGCIHKRKNRNKQYTCVAASTSKSLMYGIRRLLLRLGIYASIHFNPKNEKCIIEGRTVNQRHQYSLRINGQNSIKFLNLIYNYNIISDTNYISIPEDDNYFYSKIKALNVKTETVDVYDLTILDDHSYNINDVIVHNCIYPKITPQPIREEYLLTGELEPTNDAYAIAKIAGLVMCQKYHQQYGFNCISLMPTNLYGIKDKFDIERSHVIPALINKFYDAKINNKDHIVCWGDGSPTREFLFSDDLADTCLFLMDNYDSSEIINVGIDNEITIKELTEKIKTLIGFEGNIIWDESKPNGTPLRKLSYEKLSKLGWIPKYDLDFGLKLTIDWYLANKETCK